MDITNRGVPAPLTKLAEASREMVPADQQALLLGSATGELSQWLRHRVYAA